MSDLKLSTEELTHLWQAAQDQAVTGVPAPFHFARAVVELQARRTQPEATAPAQDLSAAILAIKLPDPQCYEYGGREPTAYSAKQMRDLLKAAAALAYSANSLSAGDSQKALDALLTRIDDAFESYERFGAICEFEGQPMIYADTLTEIVTLRGEYHAILQSQKGDSHG